MTSTTIALVALHAFLLFVAPIFMVGIVNRTKSIWGGRKGPQLHQLYFDLKRLVQKECVYSGVTWGLVKLGPTVVLATTLVAALIAPLVAGFAPVAFPYDFVVFAYVLGLGRMFLMLAA